MNIAVRIGAVFAMSFALGACALTASRPAAQPGPQPQGWPLLAPATLGNARQAQQVLRGAFATEVFTLQCVVRVQPDQLTVIGLTALGLRAFTVKYDGAYMTEQRAAQVPQFISGERLINDIQLVFWPLPDLQAALKPAGWDVSEPFHGTRRLSRDGNLIAEVHYADPDPWSGRIWLSNFQNRYSLYIDSRPLPTDAPEVAPTPPIRNGPD